MDKKSIRNIIGFFTCIVIIGCLSTLATQSILKTKREKLYFAENTTEDKSDMTPTKEDSTKPSINGGPMHNTITEEKYLSDIYLLEEQINEVWANVTESKSALSAIKYEKGVWEEQLTKIYKLYLDEQSYLNAEKLRQEYSSFEAERERLSIVAAKSANEPLDGLSYNKEYVRLTKEKTYNYIERYFSEN